MTDNWGVVSGKALSSFKKKNSIQGTASGTSVNRYGTIVYFIYLFLVHLAILSTAEIIGHQKAG